MSVYVSNVSTMLGLALAIDYSLFMVSRFRGVKKGDGRRRGRDRGRDVGQGRHVLGHRGRHRARRPARVQRPGAPIIRHRRDADRARVAVLCDDVPAGAARPPRHRVNSLSVAGLVNRIRRALGRPSARRRQASRSRWEWIANTVMAHPVVVISRRCHCCCSRACRSCASSRAFPTLTRCRRASRAARRPSRSSRASRPARRRRSSRSSTSRATRRPSPTSARSPRTARAWAACPAWNASRARSPASPTPRPASH